jgi:hypothetical protein
MELLTYQEGRFRGFTTGLVIWDQGPVPFSAVLQFPENVAENPYPSAIIPINY